MGFIPEINENTGRAYCKKEDLKKLLERARKKGWSNMVIAGITGSDPSTIRGWWNAEGCSVKLARKLETSLDQDDIKSKRSDQSSKNDDQMAVMAQSVQKEEKVTKIVLSTEDGQRLGIITIFNDVFKKLS
jgi:hypothetical protein